MNIDSLVRGLADLSDEELREKMNEIRSNRRQRIAPLKEAKTKLPSVPKEAKQPKYDQLELDEAADI